MRKRLSPCDTVLERLVQDLQDITAELGELIQEQHAVVGQQHLARHRDMTPADQPHIRDGMVGGAKWAGHDQRRAVASKASDTVDRVASMASARVIDGRMVVSRRASIDLLAPGGPSSRTLWAERLHTISLHQCLSRWRWTRC